MPRPRPDQSGARSGRPLVVAIAATQVLVAVATATVVLLGYRNLDQNIPPGEAIPHVAPQAPTEAMNILVMGSDTRAGAGNGIDRADGGGAADVSILLHVSADRTEAYGVSLPRDAIVSRPECRGEGTGEVLPAVDEVIFNEALAVGGPGCAVAQVESLTGVFVDHYVVLDFAGFTDMVDAVDGVEVCVPEPVDSKGIVLEAGTQTLEGEQALGYVRERTELAITGDIGRMKRQQAFAASLAAKVLSAGTLSRPDRVYRFLDAFTASLRVDEELDSVSALAGLARELRALRAQDIAFVTVPLAEYEPDPNRLVWTEEADVLWNRINRDAPLPGRFSAETVRASDRVDGDGGQGGQGGQGGGSGAAEERAEARRAAGLCA
ncbi:LCP family protein [Nocardioides nanhaiensis]|uniref:LCP family protein n=1 Tax=Nocardioides nanhaiensis TaxID=1476871 RepID=A0ABP8W234_9ACTN